ILGMVAALASVRFVYWIDRRFGLESSVHPDAALAVLGTLAAAMFTLIVFVSSTLLLAVQIASAPLTPPVLGLIFRDPVTKLSLTVFVFTFTFALGAIIRIKATPPKLTVYVTGYSCIVALGFFLYLIDRLGRALRPSGALRAVAQHGIQVIERVY